MNFNENFRSSFHLQIKTHVRRNAVFCGLRFSHCFVSLFSDLLLLLVFLNKHAKLHLNYKGVSPANNQMKNIGVTS